MPGINNFICIMLQCLFRSGLSIRETYLPSFVRAEHGSKLVLHIIMSVLYIYRVIVFENKYADYIFVLFFAIIEMITYRIKYRQDDPPSHLLVQSDISPKKLPF